MAQSLEARVRQALKQPRHCLSHAEADPQGVYDTGFKLLKLYRLTITATIPDKLRTGLNSLMRRVLVALEEAIEELATLDLDEVPGFKLRDYLTPDRLMRMCQRLHKDIMAATGITLQHVQADRGADEFDDPH